VPASSAPLKTVLMIRFISPGLLASAYANNRVDREFRGRTLKAV
jgi:hypothetical protein